MTSAIVLTPILLLVLLLGLLIPVIARLLRECSPHEISNDWLENFSVVSYYPMEGLLNDDDFKFLSRQPGFDLSLYRKLRNDRLRIFKQYLNRAILDFNRLHAATRALLAGNQEDCSEILSRLISLRFRFCCATVRAELSYRLCLLGYQSLAVRSLICELEEMSSQLNKASAAAHAA